MKNLARSFASPGRFDHFSTANQIPTFALLHNFPVLHAPEWSYGCVSLVISIR